MKEGKTKIFNDPIHGHIELSALSVKVVDTAQFQRLRDISQLGGVYYVFSGACSNRFEHCVGVAHLARTFVRRLQTNQPELDITEVDALCVEIAGLCHDLGHGPFSHLYDGKFLPSILHNHDFQHEHASIGILDILIEENHLLPLFQSYGLHEQDIHFIQELILGDEKEVPKGFVWQGRGEKTFLYDIVANKRNGIDVDKFDYFARDCHVLGLTKSFDALRLMKFARVFPVIRNELNSLEVCFHTKEAWNIFELFHTRYTLHKRAYQHRVSNAIELMIAEALRLADPFVFLPGRGPDGEVVLRRMSECPTDLQAYWRLGEYLLRSIEHSVSPDLQPAREVIQRLRTRDLYPFIGEVIIAKEWKAALLAASPSMSLDQAIRCQLLSLASAEAQAQHLIVQVVKLGYGLGDRNPVSSATAFFQPVKDSAADTQWTVGALQEHSISQVLPRAFEEYYLRVFVSTSTPQVVTAWKEVFARWCEVHHVQNSNLALFSPAPAQTNKRKTLHDDNESDNESEECDRKRKVNTTLSFEEEHKDI